MYWLSAIASAGSGKLSRVVWKSAMRFWVRRRMRLRPRIGYSFFDGGSTELTSTINSAILVDRQAVL